MTQVWRNSALAERHRALGSALEDWNGMGTAWTYGWELAQDHVAIRTRAALMDVSGLKKLHLVGPHASAVLDLVTTRNVEKITPGRAAYACLLNDAGKFIDDCILYRMGPNSWMVVHGSGAAHETITGACIGRNVAAVFDDDLHDLSLQGPLAVDYLARHIPDIRALPYFHHRPAMLFGRPVTLSRTGYTGERGYEIFCRAADAPAIWDTILAEGRDIGIVPAAFTALDLLRVESYLLFYPYDNSEMYPFAAEPPGDTLWELGLDFTVSPGKTGFRGAPEHYRLKGRERFRIYGLVIDAPEAPANGTEVTRLGEPVGTITCAMHSTLTDRTLAIVRLAVSAAVDGTALELPGGIAATAQALPFDDPAKQKRLAVG